MLTSRPTQRRRFRASSFAQPLAARCAAGRWDTALRHGDCGSAHGTRGSRACAFGLRAASITVTLLVLLCIVDGGKVLAGDTDLAPNSLQTPNRTLTVFSCGLREVMWTDIYSVAFYLPDRRGRGEALWDADVPKAIRVEIVYEGEVPDGLPSEWREQLEEVLSEETLQEFNALYSELAGGDVVEVLYGPKRGAVVRVNDRQKDSIVVRSPHGLIEALLELWIGEHPVSKGLRRELKTRGC